MADAKKPETPSGKGQDAKVVAHSTPSKPAAVVAPTPVKPATPAPGSEGTAPDPTPGGTFSTGKVGDAPAEVKDLSGGVDGSVVGSNPEGKGSSEGEEGSGRVDPDAASADEEAEHESVNSDDVSLRDLQDQAARKGLATTGTKQELIDRIEEVGGTVEASSTEERCNVDPNCIRPPHPDTPFGHAYGQQRSERVGY